ncbi:MAG: aconitate hydratase AcnA, partial [Planctomycetota bacterium]|nr:aconitate hydratase AcnA [Planctomycetota bacterium]
MPDARPDPFSARSTLDTPLGQRAVYRLDALGKLGNVETLPYCMKVILEACLRHCDGDVVREDDVRAIAGYDPLNAGTTEIPFRPGRVVLQDFTGVPSVVDLAAMRDAIVRLTGDESAARRVNPLVPCDLVVDHSVQVDAYASTTALTINSRKEFERNDERYRFLKWGQSAFDNFRVVPPATGIVHQVNLEYLAKVVWDDGDVLYPDSLVGTDSHTTMINGLGVVGWGVGGIEAEAVMLGQPIYMLLPDVIGVRLFGALREGATATDLVLRVTQMLRERGVVGAFVEFHGEGLANMPLANRATIANMSPEYGATMGFFPVDEQTTKYLHLTGRDEKLIEAIEQYCRLQGLWRDDARTIRYSDELELDLDSIEPSLAGPKRPQDRIALIDMKPKWKTDLDKTFNKPAAARVCCAEPAEALTDTSDVPAPTLADLEGVEVQLDGDRFHLRHGAVCIAAVTSCTNTSNPSVMIGAGLLAKKANERGLTRKPWVKSSFAPGSKVVTEYINAAGLMPHLEALGFHLVGYGCTTCIGNSGPLPGPIHEAVNAHDLVVASVLSGNRNFEGRVNPDTRANYLASPILVIAYALAGTVDIDLVNEALGTDSSGEPVYLRDIWPTQVEIDEAIAASITRDDFTRQYADVFEGSEEWREIEVSGGLRYEWDGESTYIQSPPFFEELSPEPAPVESISNARVLCLLGDSVTTDHISPAGAIAADSPAGKYLIEHGVPVSMFNSFGSRRGNDEVMTRGTFGNIRVRNHLAPGTEGGWTVDFTKDPDQAGTQRSETHAGAQRSEAPGSPPGIAGYPVTTIYEASLNYKSADIPLIVLAGRDYGMGSSRDWAAKGTYLLGVRAVLAESFERIHRSNL